MRTKYTVAVPGNTNKLVWTKCRIESLKPSQGREESCGEPGVEHGGSMQLFQKLSHIGRISKIPRPLENKRIAVDEVEDVVKPRMGSLLGGEAKHERKHRERRIMAHFDHEKCCDGVCSTTIHPLVVYN